MRSTICAHGPPCHPPTRPSRALGTTCAGSSPWSMRSTICSMGHPMAHPRAPAGRPEHAGRCPGAHGPCRVTSAPRKQPPSPACPAGRPTKRDRRGGAERRAGRALRSTLGGSSGLTEEQAAAARQTGVGGRRRACLHVHDCLGHREQRVEEGVPALVGQLDQLAPVRRAQLCPAQHARAVLRALDVAEAVHLPSPCYAAPEPLI